MKKILKITIPILFLFVLGYVGYKIVSQINHKKEVAENIKSIPKFAYQNTKGGIFTGENIKENTATLFVYYNSECDFCNEEAKSIQHNIEKFKDFQLVFISFELQEKIVQFAQKFNLYNYDNVHFLCDSKATFATTFDVKSLPCLVLYDKEQQLIEKIKGQVKAETILKKLKIED